MLSDGEIGSSWYGVRCIFRAPSSRAYEERIVIWRADTFEDAIALAEADASEYAEDIGWQYLGLSQAYRISADQIEPGVEVFSLIRDSELPSETYLDRFFATGAEHQQQTS